MGVMPVLLDHSLSNHLGWIVNISSCLITSCLSITRPSTWCWLCRINQTLPFMRKDFDYLCQLSIEHWDKNTNMILSFLKKFNTMRFRYWFMLLFQESLPEEAKWARDGSESTTGYFPVRSQVSRSSLWQPSFQWQLDHKQSTSKKMLLNVL